MSTSCNLRSGLPLAMALGMASASLTQWARASCADLATGEGRMKWILDSETTSANCDLGEWPLELGGDVLTEGSADEVFTLRSTDEQEPAFLVLELSP